MDLLNEVHFLKNIEKTPSFLVCDKKGNFWDIDMQFDKPLGCDEDRQ